MGLIIKQDHTTWCRESLMEFDLLRAYLAGLKQHLVNEGKRFHNDIETVVLDENDEYPRVVSFFRGLDDETWALEHVFTQHFPNLLLRSTLVSFYAFIEITLDTLCYRFFRYLKLSVSVSDMKDKGINRAKRYLSKLCNIDFNTLSSWQELKNIAKVRNLITHADSRINASPSHTSLLSYVESSPFLRLDGDELILSPEYIEHFLNVIQNLIEEIGSQIKT
jgi:hypothetical protein